MKLTISLGLIYNSAYNNGIRGEPIESVKRSGRVMGRVMVESSRDFRSLTRLVESGWHLAISLLTNFCK